MLDREFTTGRMTATTRRRIATLPVRQTRIRSRGLWSRDIPEARPLRGRDAVSSRCHTSLGRDRPRLRANSRSSITVLLASPGPRLRAFSRMANIKQQKKRVRTQERERLENLRYRSTIKTLTKRLETAAGDSDAERTAAEHRQLVRTIDRATARGALHRNTAARKKSQAAKIAAGASTAG